MKIRRALKEFCRPKILVLVLPIALLLGAASVATGQAPDPRDPGPFPTDLTVIDEGCVYDLDLEPAVSWTDPPFGFTSENPTVGTTNLFLAAGAYSPEEILKSVKRGLLVTELIGFGVNMVTGDYSRGAVGFWIENGEIVHPVEEITIAGNLKNMFNDIEMIGNDLVFRGRSASPTVKLRKMMVAGH